MALACVQTAHPVGEGTFCRICGSAYVQVPDAPTPASSPAPSVEAPPRPAAEPSPVAAAAAPAPLTLVPTPAASEHEVVPRHAAPEEPATRASREVPPIVLHLLGGVGIGAALMAVLDRLVL